MTMFIVGLLYAAIIYLVEEDCHTPMELTTTNDIPASRVPWWFI